MIQAYLDRFKESDKQITGKLKVYKDEILVFECCTLELSYKDNKNNISAIKPERGDVNTYTCSILEESPAFKYRHIWIQGVEGRSGVKIHIGNFYTQLNGCVLVGKSFVDINNDNYVDVTSSKETLEDLLNNVTNEFKLTIRWV